MKDKSNGSGGVSHAGKNTTQQLTAQQLAAAAAAKAKGKGKGKAPKNPPTTRPPPRSPIT